MSFVVGGEEPGGRVRRFHVLYAGARRFQRTLDRPEALGALEHHLELAVAEMAPRRLFVHAGVVGWHGRAIVIPGRSHSGKSRLVAALLRRLVVRPVAGETLVYDTRRHKLHCLAPLVARVWSACNGRRSARQIAGTVSSAAAPVDEPAVELALLRLRRARLLREPARVAGSSGPATSRREALRKAAALAGLTLVTVSAPRVLEAASCITGSACSARLQSGGCGGLPCCSGTAPAGTNCSRQGNGKFCSCR